MPARWGAGAATRPSCAPGPSGWKSWAMPPAWGGGPNRWLLMVDDEPCKLHSHHEGVDDSASQGWDRTIWIEANPRAWPSIRLQRLSEESRLQIYPDQRRRLTTHNNHRQSSPWAKPVTRNANLQLARDPISSLQALSPSEPHRSIQPCQRSYIRLDHDAPSPFLIPPQSPGLARWMRQTLILLFALDGM